ncbi:uncharacterized protein FA14DRAFT_10050 [Meira miltonrushii]|uniref:Elongator complex protein 4 n=1 Tax=Meira miltonrushii TaxID=1280837 RepID=A0A316VHP0_9BASI|nr:uncharacterized protein FA14DRAFT_10050 [Meira miltonrushii]PWN37112.1 hypothetical protein FA14DRAFT_10050 [Meira miltonrushii]
MSSFKRRLPGNAKARAQASPTGVLNTTVDGKTDVASSSSIAGSPNADQTIPPSNDDRTKSISNALPIGLRPSPFPSIVPLFSSGLASVDDLICGHGIPSSSVLALCPAIGLTSISAESGFGAPSNNQEEVINSSKRATSSRSTIEALQQAETTLLDMLAYGIAQGLIAGHRNLVLGQNAREVVEKRVPMRISSRDSTAKEEQEEKEEDMKIAFRYAHRPKFKTTVDEPSFAEGSTPFDSISLEHRFRAPFDMSKRLPNEDIQRAEESEKEDGLCILNSTKYEEILQAIDKEIQRNSKLNLSKASAIRIHLVSLGSKAFCKAGESFDRRIVQLSRFLMQIRKRVKAATIENNTSGNSATLHIICTASISADLLHPPRTTFVTQHLLRFFDAQLLLSDFANDERLKNAYAGYGGSVCLLKGPSIAAILPPGEHRSILRGGGGEAGVENDVGWRRRKRGRGLVLETLHEDVDAGQNATADTSKDAKPTKPSHSDDIEDTARLLPRKTVPVKSAAATDHTHEADVKTGVQEGVTITSPSSRPKVGASTKPSPKKFEGLKSLRERGLRAAAAAAAASGSDSEQTEGQKKQ